MDNLSNTQVEGKEALTALTGCKQPCESIEYNVIPLANWNMKFNRDPRAQGIVKGCSKTGNSLEQFLTFQSNFTLDYFDHFMIKSN